jgi:hypothetical protein
MSSTAREKPFAIVGQGTIFDGFSYWVILAGIYIMVGGLMFYSGKEKLFDDNGHPPQSIKQQFSGTWISTFPGTHAAWIILGVCEFGVFVLLLLSVIRLEFLPHRDKWLLQCGLALELLTFGFLAFGQTVTMQFAGTASIYTYFGSTVVILILVGQLPPNRSDRWLAGAEGGGEAVR